MDTSVDRTTPPLGTDTTAHFTTLGTDASARTWSSVILVLKLVSSNL